MYQAAEALTAAEDRATDSEARAEALASRRAEELKLAEQRLLAADAERQAIESKLSEANSRVQQYELALKNSESRNVAAEAKLTAAERRALEAETRANAARAALVRIEEAVRTHLLRGGRAAFQQGKGGGIIITSLPFIIACRRFKSVCYQDSRHWFERRFAEHGDV